MQIRVNSTFYSLSRTTILNFASFQAGSLQLSPVSVEITYGLERILMLLQVSFVPSFLLYLSFIKDAHIFPFRFFQFALNQPFVLTDRKLTISRRFYMLMESLTGNFSWKMSKRLVDISSYSIKIILCNPVSRLIFGCLQEGNELILS